MRIFRFSTGCARVLTIALIFVSAGRALAARPIGIDVSEYQSASLNWNTLKNSYGITFGWAKAMEGMCASCGGDNWPIYCANAKAAGVIIGPYHFARYDLHTGTDGAVAEANAFWNTVKNNIKADGLTLMPMLDVEASFDGYTKTTISQWVNAWCNTVSNNAAAVGLRVRPCVYISSYSAANHLDSSVTKWITDIADYAYPHSTAEASAQTASKPPAGIAPWTSWQFWQYDDQNVAQAITAGDGDIFNGTLAQLKATMVVTKLGPNLTSQPTSRTVLEGSNTTFTVSATGIGTLHYQWKFNQTNITGETSSSFLIPNAQMTDAGLYSVSVSDNNASTLSDSAVLSVQIPLTNAPGSVVAPTGLVNWWPADGSVNDIQGNLNSTPLGNFSYATGNSGLAFHFDGSTTMMTNTAGNIAVPWTLSLWINRSNSPQASALIVGDGNYNIKLEQYNGTRQVGLTILGVGDYKFSPVYTVPVGAWTHLAFVGTTTGTAFYANGIFRGSLTNSVPLPRKYWGGAYIASSDRFVDFMQGSMDEIMTFNRALSGSEIQEIYLAGSAGLVRGPEILDSKMVGINQVAVSLQGRTGKDYTIYSSTDLLNWFSIGTLANTFGTNQFIDNTAGEQKFYRASQPY